MRRPGYDIWANIAILVGQNTMCSSNGSNLYLQIQLLASYGIAHLFSSGGAMYPPRSGLVVLLTSQTRAISLLSSPSPALVLIVQPPTLPIAPTYRDNRNLMLKGRSGLPL